MVRHTYGFAFHVDMRVPLFMIMIEYMYSASFERNGVKSISDGFEHSLVTKRLVSYLIPFSLIWAAECVIEICQGGYSLHEMVKSYLCGGLGPESYYTPILSSSVSVSFTVFHNKKSGQ